MDKVIIKNLRARGIIGLNDWEREKKQDIIINIEIDAELHKAGETDDIEYSVNYRTVAKRAMTIAETAGKLTVEALAHEIALSVLEEERAVRARVRVEKPGAVRFADSVGVEVVRSK